ncbi:MAG TPA: hypothetical protein VMG12_41060 [Polyangiaceae bacterium]|nr:hypothetical protein [Polyangiaceae bacterium]
MIQPLKFTTLTSLPRLPLESALFVGATGTIKAAEPAAPAAVANLTRLDAGLQIELAVVVASIQRLPPPPPPPASLADLVQAARQRLARDGLNVRLDSLRRVQTTALDLRRALTGAV